MEVGKTTKAQVLETFGAPNLTIVNSTGRDVWMYNRSAIQTRFSNQGSYWTGLFVGGFGGSSAVNSSTRMTMLTIEFDKRGVVSDFSSTDSTF